MSALSADDRTRLGKLLALLSSPHLGERAEAAAAADRFVRARNLTWHEVLRPPADPFGRHGQTDHAFAKGPPSSPHELVVWCIERGGFLSKWERDYLHGLIQYGYCSRLSRRQQGVIDDIVTKIRVELRGGRVMSAPPIARVGDPAAIDRVIAVLAAHGQEHRVALLRAVRRGEVNLTEAMRTGIVPSRILRDRSRPLIVIVGDDDYATTGPGGWATLPKLLRWAGGALIHASGGDAPSYEAAIGMALARRRFLLVETDSAHAREWGDLLLTRQIPFVCFVPTGGGSHPVPLARGAAH